ncbi:DUF2242 domain-containing protein [Variovorax dokdonensis]|uniref:DUF2242 domain-containing protein n=1 Tax=Variovorax dokdonensis TaxID=344883 RepID=A0ABT7NGA6_9BURK|nr:DUF2242 domain-containing protein [Variovorax dokdonensis]MDM0046956.1 DUF2242 domain-containing protein [Variovorax dokdonensis]
MFQRYSPIVLVSGFQGRIGACSARLIAAAALGLLAAGCASTGSTARANYETEDFNSTDTHTRTFVATQAQTCEAARRALLSQGYLIGSNEPTLVSGKKAFQPDADVHLEIDFRVVCAKDSGGRQDTDKPRTIAFVSALQDRYSLKKINNSASVGVSVIGSVSLPYSQTDDSLVKVASQTVTDEKFYDRFFKIVDRYLSLDSTEPAPPVSLPVVPQARVFPEQAAPGATPPATQAGLAMVTPLAPLPPLEPQAPAAQADLQLTPPAPAAPPAKPAAPTRSVSGTVEPMGEPQALPAKAAGATAAAPSAQ